MLEERKVLGIDFGTTNSKMAFIEMDEPTMIENSEGNFNTPSVVFFKENGEVVVGEVAKRNIITYPTRTVASIKRKMGTGYKKKIDRTHYNAEYIGAHVIKKILTDANERIGIKFKDVVISVPANFTDGQRQAIKDTGEIAGVNVIKMINEPTAAALAYGFKDDEEKKVMIYDFGGGTFDVSILNICDGFFDVDASCGENMLGGDDIDHAIEEMICKKIKKDHGVNIKKDIGALQTIREASEIAKCALSSVTTTQIELPFIGKNSKGSPIKFEMELSREQLNKMIASIVENTKKPVERALKDAALEINEIDEIILVGGTTRIPYVQSFIEKTFNKKPISTVDPYEAVALGAAIVGMNITSGRSKNKIKNIDISDVISHSLGVEVADGTVSRIIDRNTKVPIARSGNYTNAGPFATEVILPVYQGEDIWPENNEFLGEFWIEIEPLPLHKNKIEVTFGVGDEFGILHVTAKDKDSGNVRTVKLESRGRLSMKEKNKWMKKMASMICLNIKVENPLSKDIITLQAHPYSTIANLKEELKRMNALQEGEELCYKNATLDDVMTISEVNLKPRSKVKIRKIY